jgi:hypothetical protein
MFVAHLEGKKMKYNTRMIQCLLILIFLPGLSACTAIFQSKELAVSTRMSDSIFLDPIADSKKIMWLKVTNTTARSFVGLEEALRSKFIAKGYKITRNPDKAYQTIQVNVLQFTEGSQDQINQAEKTMSKGFSGGITGAFIGSFIAGEDDAKAGAVVGGAIGFLAETMFKNRYYFLITDVQVSQRASLTMDGSKKEVQSSPGKWQRQKSRVLNIANSLNLKPAEAATALRANLSKVLAGFF